MKLHPATIPSVDEYQAAFWTEAVKEYPEVTAFEEACGYAIDRVKLSQAAEVLACPVKANPPNWQHGRVLYAAARKYLAAENGPVQWFDCGTAKGFSALIGVWALADAGVPGTVDSVDVIDPKAQVFRNSVLDVTKLNILPDYLVTWPEAESIRFHKMTGIEWLVSAKRRVEIAFIDGKHSTDVVESEGALLAGRQNSGDLVLFDDAQILAVAKALKSLSKFYEFEMITLSAAKRAYAVGVRR
jgi:hypothetical protein